jgi:hypothetical protein
MQSNRLNKSIVFLLATLLLVSCASRKDQKQLEKVDKVNDKTLIAKLSVQDYIPFNYLTSKVNVDLKSNAQDRSFAVYLKHSIDTAIGGTMKYAQFAGAIFKVTQDSVILANKMQKCYFLSDLNYLTEMFGTEVEFDFFQDLILGLPIGFDSTLKYQQINNPYKYILSSHKKKTFRKLENDKLEVEEDVMLVQYEMKPRTFELARTTIHVPSDSVFIAINYVQRKEVEGVMLPEETLIEITHPTDTISIRLDYGSIKLNEWREIDVRIPASYENCR